MQYRSISDMNQTIVQNLHRLPDDIELVVGVPRSGVLAANLVSLAVNIPMTDLDSYLEGRVYTSGLTKRLKPRAPRATPRVLVIDDSVNEGRAMRTAKSRLEQAGINAEFVFAAVYGIGPDHPETDIIFEVIPTPRLFQWNFMHHTFLGNACVDIDGVLCLDPTREENDDGPAYEAFLIAARPLYAPTRKIRWLVTSRLEKYRPQTEAWLADRGIEYEELVMLDLPSKEERQRLAAHGSFKAEFYRQSNAIIFIESEESQAVRIARLSGKPVLSLETHRLITPDALALPAHLKNTRTANGRKALLKLAAQTVLGTQRYEALKRRVLP